MLMDSYDRLEARDMSDNRFHVIRPFHYMLQFTLRIRTMIWARVICSYLLVCQPAAFGRVFIKRRKLAATTQCICGPCWRMAGMRKPHIWSRPLEAVESHTSWCSGTQ